MSLFACGNCVFYAMWQRFPPIGSWIVIIPLWFLALSSIRTFTPAKLAGVPALDVAIPLVLAVYLLAPGMIGPPLGFWIPICCIVATVSGVSVAQSPNTRKLLIGLTALAAIALVGFGMRDYLAYIRMPTAEKEKFLPCWERAQREWRSQ